MNLLKKFSPVFDLNDAFILAGAGLVGTGIWWIYRPAALIAVGLCLLWLGITGSRSKG